MRRRCAKPGSGRPLLSRRSILGSARAASNASTSADRMRSLSACRTPTLLEMQQARSEFLTRTPEYAYALCRRRDGARGRHQAPDARSSQLLRDHRRARPLPRLRRSHRDPYGDRRQPRDPRQAAQGSHPRDRKPDRATQRQAARRPPTPNAGPASARAHLSDRSRPWRSISICSRAGRGAMVRRAGDRHATGCSERLRFDLPVQPLHRSVGEQPVPGHPRRRQGLVRGARAPSPRRCAGAKDRRARPRGRLRSRGPRQASSAPWPGPTSRPKKWPLCRPWSAWAATGRPTASASARSRAS